MITYINTQKVKDISDRILSATNDLEAEFDALFERFANVPTVTKEWVGDQADFYFTRVAGDKKEYMTLVSELRQIAKELGAEATNTQAYIKSNNTEG